MNSRTLVLINVIGLLVFLVWFLSSRRNRGPGPTQLNLREGFRDDGPTRSPSRAVQPQEAVNSLTKERSISSQTSASSATSSSHKSSSDKSSQGSFQSASSSKSGVSPARETLKDLNVIFIYNGHTFDAYEVLGLPAGSPIVDVTKKYQRELIQGQTREQPFLEAAYKAILNSSTRRN